MFEKLWDEFYLNVQFSLHVLISIIFSFTRSNLHTPAISF